MKEGYKPVINLVTPESTPVNRKRNVESDDCPSPPPPSILLKSSRQKGGRKKSVRFDFDCNLESASSTGKRKKNSDKEELDASPNTGDVVGSEDRIILDGHMYTISEYQPPTQHGTRDRSVAANSNRNNNHGSNDRTNMTISTTTGQISSDDGNDGTTDNIDMISTTDGNRNKSNRNNNDETNDVNQRGTTLVPTTMDDDVNDSGNDEVHYSDVEVMLRQNDVDNSNLVDDGADGDDADDDDVADFDVEYDADGDVPVSFQYSTPGNCDMTVGLGEREDRLDDISIANDDGIQCVRHNLLDDGSIVTEPSIDGCGSGSGSGSGSGATIESNLTVVGRYNDREYTRGEIEESGYSTWVCF